MTKYKIQIKKSVQKDLSFYDKQTNKRLIQAIQKLGKDPYKGSKKIIGANLYRIRVGKYRIIYQILTKDLVVMVYKVGHRTNIYRSSK